ncbi:hypothetical protein BH11BAC2_BH11BAC2_22480 [soil metagenome]
MKKLWLTLLLVFFNCLLWAQTSGVKTKIVVIGTFSFVKALKDATLENVYDFSSVNRQKEIASFINKLKGKRADKILMDFPVKNELLVDSLYNAFLKGSYQLSNQETEQIGFRLAKEMHLKRVYAIDEKTPMKRDSLLVVAAQLNQQQEILEKLNLEGELLKTDFDSVLTTSTFSDILSYLNSEKQQLRNISLYHQYMVKVGAGKNYEGVDYVTDRYRRSLSIYANIVSRVSSEDRLVIVIIGQGYVPFLKEFFQAQNEFQWLNYTDFIQE